MHVDLNHLLNLNIFHYIITLYQFRMLNQKKGENEEMRKAISFLLTAMLLIAGSIGAYAADATVPSDVQGTKYEEAVKTLLEKNITAGYPDNTFRPDKTIDRAEMCTIIVKAMGASEEDMKAAANAFNDMAGYDWALHFVNYGAANSVTAGKGGGKFAPADPVTYNEVATMLVKALGYTDKDLTGTYPESYTAKAAELGILKNVDISGKGETPATRGDVALMTASVAQQIIDKHQKNDGEEENEKPNTTGGAVTGGSIAPSDNNSSVFKSAGGAFGMINGVSSVLAADGNKVDQIEFLMGGNTYYLNTKDSGVAPRSINYDDGVLYYIKFNTSKEVKDVFENPSAGNAKHYSILAGSSTWADVLERSSRVVTTVEDGQTSSSAVNVTIGSDAAFYKAVFKGSSIDSYESGRLGDIGEGAKIRIYHVSDDDAQVGDVVVYVEADDAARI